MMRECDGFLRQKLLTLTPSRGEREKKGMVRSNVTSYESDDYTAMAYVVYIVQSVFHRAKPDTSASC
jgi:ATP-dependent Clp protease adapter protein ClpS